MAVSPAEKQKMYRRRARAKALNARIWADPQRGARTPDQLDAQRELARARAEVAAEEGVAVGYAGPNLELLPGAVKMVRDPGKVAIEK